MRTLSTLKTSVLIGGSLETSEDDYNVDDFLRGVHSDSDSECDSEPRSASGSSPVDDSDKVFIELESKIPDRDFTKFIMDVAQKTVKQDPSLVKQITFTGLSAYTRDPLNLLISAPTSEGKTYPVIQTLKPFPKEDVWKLGSMSPKVIIRQNGILVDSNNEPIQERVNELKKEIAKLMKGEGEDEGGSKQDEIFELKQKLNKMQQEAKVLIDLSNKIFIFLEPPHSETWTILKPILSHDDYEIEHPYVYEVEGMGFKVKKIVTRGWPAFIFCTAKDESNWPQWPEIVSRCLVTSPNMVPIKYQESNKLISQLKGLPGQIQQKIIVSDEQIELAKKCLTCIKRQIQELSKIKNPVWIPFCNILAEALPSERGTDTRSAKRIFSLLGIIPLTKAHLRPTLIFDRETLVTATLEDLNETLHITQNVNGIPSYKMRIFKDVICEKYKENGMLPLTARAICEYYKRKTGRTMNSENLRKRYLAELINNGLIEEETSSEDKRQKNYYPLVDLDANAADLHVKNTGQTGLESQSVNFSHPFVIKLPKNCTNIPENWLTFEILTLGNYGTGLDKIQLHDPSRNKLSIRQFVEVYEKTDRLVLYFSKPNFTSYHSEVFGDIKYLDSNIKKDAGNYRTEVSVPFVPHFSDEITGDLGSYSINKPPPRPPMEDPNPNPADPIDQGANESSPWPGSNLCSDNNDSNSLTSMAVLEIPRCSPFVKWAGGKTQLLKELNTMIPSKFNRYFEPFLGGGAMFFYLVSCRNLRFSAHLSDINTNLIACYQTLKYDANGLAEALARYEKEYKESNDKRGYYNRLRDDYNYLRDQSSLDKAARFIVFNKTCFNGLYRVNQEGKFDTPWGKRDNPTMYDSYNLRKICVALNSCGASITTNYYEAALSDVKKDDFVYLDPPYYPISETANFTNYSASGFSKRDHVTLSKVFAELANRGSKVLLSNSNTDFIKQLYSGFTIREVNASRAINSDASKRGKNKNTELIISNYLPVTSQGTIIQ